MKLLPFIMIGMISVSANAENLAQNNETKILKPVTYVGAEKVAGVGMKRESGSSDIRGSVRGPR